MTCLLSLKVILFLLVEYFLSKFSFHKPLSKYPWFFNAITQDHSLRGPVLSSARREETLLSHPWILHNLEDVFCNLEVLYSPVLFCNHSKYDETSENTDGRSGTLHPFGWMTYTPTNFQRLSLPRHIRGPPESP